MTTQHVSKHYKLEQVGDGIHAAIAKDGGAAISNAGIIDLGDSTLVVDTFLTPTAAEDLRADAECLTGRPTNWVVSTHYHNDHIWGNQVFLPEAEIISTAATRALIQTAGQEEYDDYRAITSDRLKETRAQQAAASTEEQRGAFELMIGYFAGLERDFPRLRLTVPNMTFENRMVLEGSRRRAELIAFSGAHTGSDTVVYLPDDGVVFMSDLLFIHFHPYLGDGDPDRCLKVLQSIRDGTAGIQNVSRFVPGHGPIGGPADLERLADYIRQCQQLARALAAQGKIDPADAASTPIPAAYAGWGLQRFFPANLKFLLEKYRNADRAGESVKTGSMPNSFRPSRRI